MAVHSGESEIQSFTSLKGPHVNTQVNVVQLSFPTLMLQIVRQTQALPVALLQEEALIVGI
jgi:hypothetical protein